MSSAHTRVSNYQWQEMQRRIAEEQAYIINMQQEADRITQLAAERRREAEEIHNANQQTIQNAVSALRTSFSETVERLEGQVGSQIRAQTDGFNGQLDSIRSDLSGISDDITSLDRRIDSVANTYNNAFQGLIDQESQTANRAEIIANELSNLLTQIEELDPQHFTPAEYMALVSLQNSLTANINTGDYQAAIMLSQNGIIDGSRLLARLIISNERYNDRLRSGQIMANELQNRIERFSSSDGVLSVESNGEKQEIEYDISYWSFGRFDSLVDEYKHLQSLLNNPSLTIEQLEEVISTIAILDENLTVCDQEARRERAGAIASADTAMRLYNGLSSSGWNLNDSGYNNQDERNPYAMTYEDESGNTLSVVVAAESPEQPSFILEVFSDDDYLAEITKEGVNALLEEEGITIDDVEYRDDCPDNPNPETFIENASQELLVELEPRRQRT